MYKPTDNQFPIHEILKKRWSTRAFSAQPVEGEKLLSLFEAARWSPSSRNAQPWAFVIATAEDEAFHAGFVASLTGSNPQWAMAAPVLVLAVAEREPVAGVPNAWAMYDLGQAVANLTVQASAMDLYVHQMGGFDREKARALFHVPQGYDPAVAMAIGYMGNVEDLPDPLRLREKEARQRKPLDSFVFAGRWHRPIAVQVPVQVME
jgi:nitroreductase